MLTIHSPSGMDLPTKRRSRARRLVARDIVRNDANVGNARIAASAVECLNGRDCPIEAVVDAANPVVDGLPTAVQGHVRRERRLGLASSSRSAASTMRAVRSPEVGI